MHKVTVLFLLLSSLSFGIDQDKVQHFSLSYALSSAGYFTLPKDLRWLGPIVAIGVGTAKELMDPRIDSGDLLADGVGIGCSVLVLELE